MTDKPDVVPRLFAVGWILIAGGKPPTLCSALLTSLPPDGVGVELVGLDANAIPGLTAREGVRWTKETVAVTGHIHDERLIVDGPVRRGRWVPADV
jgi:hypothetical protein